MSDQGYDPQQPGVPAPPPAYPPPGTQPYAPPGAPAYGQPPLQPPAQPKKSRAGLIILVISLLALCGIVSCGVVGLGLYKVGSKAVDVGQAEAHYSAALASVDKAGTALKSAGSGASPAKVAAVTSSADGALRTARDEIASAKGIVGGWSQSPGRTDYLGSLAAATKTMDVMQNMVAYLKTAGAMLSMSSQAGAKAKAGNDALNAAIHAGNQSNYSKMRSKGQLASTDFTAAAVLFRQAHKLDPSAGLDKAARYCDARKKQADIVIRMASEGHRISAYNRDVNKMNAQGRAADRVGTPAIAADRTWATKRLAGMEAAITSASQKADELHTKALQELGSGK